MKFAGDAQVMPVLFGVMRSSDDALRDFLFQQLTVLVSFLRQHVRKYLPDILSLVHDYWIPTSALMPHILRLLSELSGEIGFLLNLKFCPCPICYACCQSCQVKQGFLLHLKLYSRPTFFRLFRSTFQHLLVRINVVFP